MMPSPFPGMDPYLEGPSWMSFHGQFIAEIARQLSPKLRPRYVALMDKRVIWDAPDDDVWIDAVEARLDVGSSNIALRRPRRRVRHLSRR